MHTKGSTDRRLNLGAGNEYIRIALEKIGCHLGLCNMPKGAQLGRQMEDACNQAGSACKCNCHSNHLLACACKLVHTCADTVRAHLLMLSNPLPSKDDVLEVWRDIVDGESITCPGLLSRPGPQLQVL